MQQGMRADYRIVDRLSDKLRERMLRAKTLTVRTEAGTEFVAHFDRGLDWVKTSGLINPRYWSNLPAGEVFTTPATVDGTFVCDATAGDHFNGKYGDLQSTTLVDVLTRQCDVWIDDDQVIEKGRYQLEHLGLA